MKIEIEISEEELKELKKYLAKYVVMKSIGYASDTIADSLVIRIFKKAVHESKI